MSKSLHEICVEAVNKMVEENISHHVSYISGEDAISFGLKEGGKIPKVTIEWVEEEESYPKPGDPGYDAFVASHEAAQQGVQRTGEARRKIRHSSKYVGGKHARR